MLRPWWLRMRISLPDKSTLTGRASRALGWSFASTFLTRVSTLGIGVFLARLLGPHAFGAYAVAFVALNAMQTFNELGVSLAIVRWESDPGEIAPTVTTISVLGSVILFIGSYFAAPAYASVMGAAEATSVVRLLAVAILIDGFANTPNGLLQRQFRQDRAAIAVQVGNWLGTGVTAALAWTGHGAMSLAIGRVAGAAVCVILLIAFAPGSLRFGFNPEKARELLRFGLPLGGANFVSFAVTSVDQLVVGHMLGAPALGLYVLASNLASWPMNMFSRPVSAVAPAVLSRLQHDRVAMRDTFLAMAALLGAVTLPVCLLIGGSADPLIGFVYGRHWLPAAQPLIWLALLGALRVFLMLAYDYLVVLARSRFLLTVQLIWLLTLVPALVAGAHADGIYGVGLAEVIVATAVVLPCYLGELKRASVRLSALGRRLWLPATGAAVAWLLATEVPKVAPTEATGLVASGAGTLAILGLLAYRMRSVFALLRSVPAEPGRSAMEPSAPMATDVPPLGTAGYSDGITEELRAILGVIEASPRRFRDEVQGEAVRGDRRFSSRMEFLDMTQPLLAYRSATVSPQPRQDSSMTSPLYWKTVASRNLNPARATYRDQIPVSGRHHMRGQETEAGAAAYIPAPPARSGSPRAEPTRESPVDSEHGKPG